MKKLRRCELDFKPALQHVSEHLKGWNTLSIELCNLINFEGGRFFTLLPDNADRTRIYMFREGGILPAGEIQNMHVLGGIYSGEIISTMQDEVAEVLLNILRKDPTLSCIFEEVLLSPTSRFLDPFYAEDLVRLYGPEVYYIVSNRCANLELIKKCMEHASQIWHFVCILTISTINNQSFKEINLNDIRSACLNAKLLVVGSYDGEGCIFWERNDFSLTCS